MSTDLSLKSMDFFALGLKPRNVRKKVTNCASSCYFLWEKVCLSLAHGLYTKSIRKRYK